ncbi:hypothetical protein TUM4438_37880 [Shewanella sairae]|uniref:Uncharacterized protein n=1 Tax=Shewanella sairae TaxID=190310 RepID=A0ABQ4PQ49_9GAMM|nr:hypothetical protein TUM4438_37880 [Shewanella sairae]
MKLKHMWDFTVAKTKIEFAYFEAKKTTLRWFLGDCLLLLTTQRGPQRGRSELETDNELAI